jgi:outer membrane protein insertion porin family
MNRILILVCLLISGTAAMAQVGTIGRSSSTNDDPTYINPKEYVVGGTTISGIQFLDKDVLIIISKLTAGQRILVPGEATAAAVKNLWDQNLFDDVKLNITQIRGDSVFFDIAVVERPRLTKIALSGISKSQITELNKKLDPNNGKVVNDNLYNSITGIIKKHFNDKGFLFTEVDIKQQKDTSEANNVVLNVKVDRHSKVKVNKIAIEGNTEFKSAQLKKWLKKTHEKAFYKVFGSGKFLRDKYEEDKKTMVAKMQDKGFRDAEILSDTVMRHDDKTVDISMKIHEGRKYFFGNITWTGNALYNTEGLNKILGIEKGNVFSEELLDKKLLGSADGGDVSTLYLDNGYLTFHVDPVQTKVYGDTIDLELRIYEGPQYTIDKIILKGNEVTNDKVVLREIRTKPGDKFSKDAIVRTQREIASLGNFDDKKTNVVPTNINSSAGTVDIEYTVEEKSSDQVELSGGFGGGRIIGTLGLTFNNFASKNIFNLKEWRPLPKGDGQKLSLRGQTNGKQYQSYSFSYSDPWFGGKRKIYFGISAFTSLQSNQYNSSITDAELQRIRLNGITFTLGKQLKWPDDWFAVNYSLNFQQYKLKNYGGFLFSTGTSYNFNLTQQFSRNSLSEPLFPRSGSNLRMTIQATPPYSLLNNLNYAIAPDKDKYRFTEYHKWKFEAQWFTRVFGNLILKSQAQFGFLGQYSHATGQSAFERFKLGGDGMQGFDFLQGSEIIGLRGYMNNTVIPVGANPTIAQQSGSPIFTKYVLELRHPISLNQQATIYGLAFADAGNTWDKFRNFSPFNVRRSVGVGARVYLSIFGLLGLDYGYGFDKIPGLPQAAGSQFHFSISQSIGGGTFN